jgi:hypothetical protein
MTATQKRHAAKGYLIGRGQCEERRRHAGGPIGEDAEDRTMILIGAGEALNQL